MGTRIRECQGIGAGTPWGLLAPEKRCFEAAPCRGLARRLRRGSGTCRPMGFLANFGARRFPKGNEGKRVSSGYNRRRRLATRSSGKQQAERTAVRTAPIVCPEESPLVRPQAHISCRGGADAPTTARTVGLPPRGGSTFFRSERKYQRKHAARRLQRRPAPLRVIRKYRRSGHCRARPLYLLRPVSR